MNNLQERKRALLSNTSTRTLLESAIVMEAIENPSQEERMVCAWVFDELLTRVGVLTPDEDEEFMRIYDETDNYLAALIAVRPQLGGVK